MERKIQTVLLLRSSVGCRYFYILVSIFIFSHLKDELKAEDNAVDYRCSQLLNEWCRTNECYLSY